MKVYFGAALAQKEEYGEYYDRIVRVLEKLGHKVLLAHSLESHEEAKKTSVVERAEIHQKSLDLIGKCDIAIFEVSFPSTIRIGYEVSVAIEKRKPAIALYLQGRESVYFTGIKKEKMFLSDYRDFDLEEVVKESINYGVGQTETRYNLFLSSRHMSYLESVSSKTKTPRSAYIRKLIEEDIQKNNEEI
jgi:nucleoside 2-deoxyribosyltransferase